MVIGFTLFVIAVLIIGIWIIIEMKRMKHKLFAIFLIALILLLYLSSTIVFKGQDIQWNSVSGLIDGTKLYFSWFGSLFTNMKSITSYAVKMDWKSNETIENDNKGFFKLSPEE